MFSNFVPPNSKVNALASLAAFALSLIMDRLRVAKLLPAPDGPATKFILGLLSLAAISCIKLFTSFHDINASESEETK